MQAYKGLYEDQLQTQHASAESYRSLTKGFSRLSADNKVLRQNAASTASASTTVALPTSAKNTKNFDAEPMVSVKTQRAQNHGDGVETAVPKSLCVSNYFATARCATQRASSHGERVEIALRDSFCVSSTTNSTGSSLPGTDRSDVEGVKPTAAETAEAFATAAAAVAAAAGALAVAVASSTDDAKLLAATNENEECVAKMLEEGTSSSRALPIDYCGDSTVETLACSPFSDENMGTVPKEKKDGFEMVALCDHPPRTEPSQDEVNRMLSEKPSTGTDICICTNNKKSYVAAEVEATYAFPRSGGRPYSARPNHRDALQSSRGNNDRRGYHAVESVLPRPAVVVAVPPVEPSPRWRGRSTGPGGRRLSSSSSWGGQVVDAPKQSSSPTPPRRGRWEAYGSSGGRGWGGVDISGKGGCTRIEPSRTRPHSI